MSDARGGGGVGGGMVRVITRGCGWVVWVVLGEETESTASVRRPKHGMRSKCAKAVRPGREREGACRRPATQHGSATWITTADMAVRAHRPRTRCTSRRGLTGGTNCEAAPRNMGRNTTHSHDQTTLASYLLTETRSPTTSSKLPYAHALLHRPLGRMSGACTHRLAHATK